MAAEVKLLRTEYSLVLEPQYPLVFQATTYDTCIAFVPVRHFNTTATYCPLDETLYKQQMAVLLKIIIVTYNHNVVNIRVISKHERFKIFEELL